MSLSLSIQSHWIAVFAGEIPNAQAPVEVTIVQNSDEHTLRVIPFKTRRIPADDGTQDTIETVKVMLLKNPLAAYLPKSIHVGGLELVKLGDQLTLHNKKYTHTGEILDDSDVYTVAVFERRFRSIQGRGNR